MSMSLLLELYLSSCEVRMTQTAAQARRLKRRTSRTSKSKDAKRQHDDELVAKGNDKRGDRRSKQ